MPRKRGEDNRGRGGKSRVVLHSRSSRPSNCAKLPEKTTEMKLLMVVFVVVAYAFAFLLDSLANSRQLYMVIGNTGVSYAGFIELVLFVVACIYIWKTGDVLFFILLVLSFLVFVMCAQLTFGRLM